MPCYRTHARFNLILALPLILAGLINREAALPDICCFVSAFAYATILIHPDLDLAYQTKLFSLKGLLTLPFRPYSWICRHRGVSHWPVLGTATRLLYLGALLWLLKIPGWPINHDLIWIFFGMAAADGMHEVLDGIEKIIR